MYGRKVADEVIYKRLINIMKKEWSLYTVFDLLRGLNSWNFRRQKDLVLYFGYNLDNVPLEKLVEFAHA